SKPSSRWSARSRPTRLDSKRTCSRTASRRARSPRRSRPGSDSLRALRALGRERIDQLRAEIRRRIWLRQPAVDRADVAHRNVFVAFAGSVAAVRDFRLAQRNLAAAERLDETFVKRGADARRTPARIHRVHVLAPRREIVADL